MELLTKHEAQLLTTADEQDLQQSLACNLNGAVQWWKWWQWQVFAHASDVQEHKSRDAAAS